MSHRPGLDENIPTTFKDDVHVQDVPTDTEVVGSRKDRHQSTVEIPGSRDVAGYRFFWQVHAANPGIGAAG